MRKYILRILLLLLIPLSFLLSSSVQNKYFNEDEEIWSGTVSFVEIQSGKEIVVSEWKMEAKVTNNKGTAVHSFHYKNQNGNISDCRTEDKTELSVGIDYEEAKYSIEVPVPGCYGKQTSNGYTVDFAQSDETAIQIDDQPLKDPNVLSGTITNKTGPDENGNATKTTYKWHLVRSGKKKPPVSQKTSKPKPQNTQPFTKERWSGTVTWIKTSAGKARVVSHDHGFENVYLWDNYMAYHTDVNFVNSKGTVFRADTATKWEKDSVIFIHPENKYMIEERTTKIYRKCKEDFELKVEFSEDKKTYWISFFGPICPELMFFERKNNIHGNSSDSSTYQDAGIQITLPANFTGHPVGNNPNILTGTFEEIIPPNPNDPASQKIITRARWELKKTK